MKKHLISLMLLLAMGNVALADDVKEAADPYPGPQEAWQKLTKPMFVWGTTDVRYSRSQVPTAEKMPELYAWRGEHISAQAVFATPSEVELTLSVSDLKSGKNVIPASNINPYFVGYVLADGIDKHRVDSCLMADRLIAEPTFTVAGNTTRPIWLDIRVPKDAAPGTYAGTVSINCQGTNMSLPIRLKVSQRVLPDPKEWSFHLDLWQNPYSVARYFNVPLWSKEHFDKMRPLMEMYAQAGGKVITASIIQHPWNSQTHDPFESMIVKMKGIDGQWTYDYTVFDRWIEFMMSCGVTEQIDCYTIVPWGYQFEYIDMATSTLQTFECNPGEKAYEDYILPFLTDFARHLKAKGWFSKTCIAMDERPMDQLRVAWDIVRRADPDYRIEGAVNYSPEVVSMMYDISLGYRHVNVPAEVAAQRRAEGKRTTFYTCVNPPHPNTFTFSPPAEATFIGWHAAALGFDGYLRWAFNSWTPEPCVDSRNPKWYSGDTHLVYPEGSSIRYERLIQGIQDYEKFRILRAEATPAQQKKLDALLLPFAGNDYPDDLDAGPIVKKAEAELRKYE